MAFLFEKSRFPWGHISLTSQALCPSSYERQVVEDYCPHTQSQEESILEGCEQTKSL